MDCKAPPSPAFGLPKPAFPPSSFLTNLYMSVLINVYCTSLGSSVFAFLSWAESLASRGYNSSLKETPLWKRCSFAYFKLLPLAASGEPPAALHLVFTASSLNREVVSDSPSCEFFNFHEPSDCWTLAPKLILISSSSFFKKLLDDAYLIKLFLL